MVKRKVNPEVMEKRDKQIVAFIQKGIRITRLGKLFGLSRERISQIYFLKTGISVSEIRLKVNIEAAEKAMLPGQVHCHNCGVPLPTLLDQTIKYCSNFCARLGRRKYIRAYQEAHRGRIRATQKRYYQRNREKIYAQQREYMKKRFGIGKGGEEVHASGSTISDESTRTT